jgi:hypothetical protein
MSWGTCYKGSNNIHFNFPPLMMDGRNFSSYEMAPAQDTILKERANIKTNSDYRRYLQTNADSIIKNNQLGACDECGVCPYYNSSDNQTSSTPYIFNSSVSNDQPHGYESSDLKNIYLSAQQLNTQKHIPRFQINA